MGKRQDQLTHARLLELLLYDPETGVFTHRVTRHSVVAGAVAGCIHAHRDGSYPRWQLVIDGVHHKAHRVAWFYVHGRWPSGVLDHRDGDALNNRISNLREATFGGNSANSRHARGSTQYRGVSYCYGGYMAQISHKNRSVYLGRFATAEAAYAAWCEAALRLRGEFVKLD